MLYYTGTSLTHASRKKIKTKEQTHTTRQSPPRHHACGKALIESMLGLSPQTPDSKTRNGPFTGGEHFSVRVAYQRVWGVKRDLINRMNQHKLLQ